MFKRKADDAGRKDAGKEGFFARLRRRVRGGWLDNLGGGAVDEAALEELETRLLLADVGVNVTERIIEGLRKRVSRRELGDRAALASALSASLLEILAPCAQPLRITGARPFVILVLGVNGAGKTTTIGKLARQFRDEGRKVMLAAGDTFRAAAVEQLAVWGERNDVPVVSQSAGADPAAVVFDALGAARARGIDVLLADTAGRLHTQDNLMGELRKIKRVMARHDEHAPHESLLVLDATSGQNALAQARRFNDAIGVTGLALTKLDGTAKGGIVIAISDELGLPLRYVGVGEAVEDLGPFDAEAFVSGLL